MTILELIAELSAVENKDLKVITFNNIADLQEQTRQEREGRCLYSMSQIIVLDLSVNSRRSNAI